MQKLQKRIRKIVRNPNDVKFEELQYVLLKLGCTERKPGGGSSHYFYKNKEAGVTLTIPKKKPIKEVYVKKVIKLFNLDEY